jgi:hypothetical protein
MRVFLALALCTTAHALAVGAIPLLRCTAAPALCVSMSSDEALWASLKARIAVSEDESAAPPPLGIDDVGADCMGPSDVVEYVMRSMKADADAGATGQRTPTSCIASRLVASCSAWWRTRSTPAR